MTATEQYYNNKIEEMGKELIDLKTRNLNLEQLLQEAQARIKFYEDTLNK